MDTIEREKQVADSPRNGSGFLLSSPYNHL